jgi:hypothetical protein
VGRIVLQKNGKSTPISKLEVAPEWSARKVATAERKYVGDVGGFSWFLLKKRKTTV